jgi:hypothetical protein
MAVSDRFGRVGSASSPRVSMGAIRAGLTAIFDRVQAEPTPAHLLRLVDRLERESEAEGRSRG